MLEVNWTCGKSASTLTADVPCEEQRYCQNSGVQMTKWRLHLKCTITELVIMQADNFQLRSTSHMGQMSSMSNSMASFLCVGKVASLWPLLFFTVIVVESSKVFISPASSKCYLKCACLKVKGKRLSFKVILITFLCRQNITSTELVERCRVKVFPSLRNFMMIVN